jgi:hypothetical protein
MVICYIFPVWDVVPRKIWQTQFQNLTFILLFAATPRDLIKTNPVCVAQHRNKISLFVVNRPLVIKGKGSQHSTPDSARDL